MSFSLRAQEECDQAALSRQCYTQLCTSRTNIPDTTDGLAEDLARNTGTLPPEAITNIRNQANQVRSYLADLTPAPDSTYLAEADRYIANPELAVNELQDMAHRLVGKDRNGNQIYNDMLTPEETARNTNLESMIYGIFDRTVLQTFEQTVSANTPYEITEAELRQISELASFVQRTDPARSAAMLEIRESLRARTPIAAGAWQRANFTQSSLEYSADYLRAHRVEVSETVKNYERLIVTRSAVGVERALTNCQVVQYLGQKALAANNPQTLDRMARNVLGALEQKFYPRLSEESAVTLRRYLQPSTFKLVTERPDFSFFQPFGATPATTRTARALALDNLTSARCQLSTLSRDFTDDHAEQTVSSGIPTIMISSLSLAQNAEAVLAHEMGHAITVLMASHPISSPSAQKMAVLRSCLNSMHPAETRAAGPDVSSIAGDRFHTDEDFGDWISGTLGFDTDYLSCDLPRLFDIGKRATPVTLTAEPNDPHSTDLFRLLHTRTLRDQPLPQVCRELVQQTPSEQPKKCEL